MKRQAISLAELSATPNLELATWKAVRGKHQRPGVLRWLAQLDDNLSALAAAITGQRAPQHGLRRFAILDPKPREISAHSLADRVLHHAILNLAEPRFERMLVDTSFACRPGLGVHRAVLAARLNLQRHPWWVQVDVAGYFASINHALLLDLLARRFKGNDFLALLRRIVESGAPAGATQGLPIGALTSQHFANAYLDSADRFLLALPEVQAQVRYMDDIVWWCASRAAAEHTLAALRAHLWCARQLQLKPNAQVGASDGGLRFCGFRVHQGVVLPSARKLARYREGARRLSRAEAEGLASGADLRRACAVLDGTLAHTQSQRFRQGVWAAVAARTDQALGYIAGQ